MAGALRALLLNHAALADRRLQGIGVSELGNVHAVHDEYVVENVLWMS
jgi:hypothetical protein